MKNLTNENLIEQYCNVYKTYQQCGGHGKASANKIRANELSTEIQNRKLNLPPQEEISAKGIFNGAGAY